MDASNSLRVNLSNMNMNSIFMSQSPESKDKNVIAKYVLMLPGLTSCFKNSNYGLTWHTNPVLSYFLQTVYRSLGNDFILFHFLDFFFYVFNELSFNFPP